MASGYSEKDIICFDTETTGLGPEAEACQIAVVDYNEKIMFNHLIKPVHPISEEAMNVHKITNEMVANEKSLSYWWSFLQGNIFSEKIVLGYNVMFDWRILLQSANQLELKKSIAPMIVIDVMILYKKIMNESRWLKLETAALSLDVHLDEELVQFHDAAYDALTTLRIYKKLMELK